MAPGDGGPKHQVWGEAEALSCYGSSSHSSKHETQPVNGRKLPQVVLKHLADNVTQLASSDSSSAELTPGQVQLPASSVRQASVGSELHNLGECKPCLYLNSKVGCYNGQDCKFCHLQHSKKNTRPRPCKATRIQCKQIASMLNVFAPEPEQMLELTERLGAKSSYMQSILRGKQRELVDEIAEREASSPGQRPMASHGAPFVNTRTSL
uniref:C3H1-type domain-containing protein n=1 Tax=Pyrodinium bahamense TaxID=73915 RepID=A0A7S0FYH5_9DINO